MSWILRLDIGATLEFLANRVLRGYSEKAQMDSAVMRVRLADGHVEEVASLKGMRLAGRLAGLAYALTPEGDPLVLRDIGTQEMYSLDWHGR